MENEESGITLGRVLKVAFRRWKLLVPVAACVAAALILGIELILNPMRGSYSSTFSYSSYDISQGKYADGTNFYYMSLVSSNTLSAVKDSDEKYSSIDVDAILETGGISISSDTDAKKYTISLAYRYIKNASIAKSFIKDIAEYPIKKNTEIVNESGFDAALKLFDEADTFEQQVEYLAQEADFFKNNYANLSSLDSAIKEKAEANSKKISLLIDENFVSGMKYRINKGGFVKDYNGSEAKNYETRKLQLQEEKNLNDTKITALENEINNITVATAISSLSAQMETLILKNEDIKYEIDGIDAKLANKGKDPATIPGYNAFVADLDYYKNTLSNAINDYREVLKFAYIDNAEVAYEKTSVMELNRTVNIYITIAGSLVAGVVVGAVVNLIVDRKKLYE